MGNGEDAVGPKTKELVALLTECSSLLLTQGGDGGAHWAEWLERDATKLRNGDFHGIEDFLGAFGGMGSINDFILEDDRFQLLLSRAYELAMEMSREFHSASRT